MTSTDFRGSVRSSMAPYIYVLISLACFSGASVWYGEFARRFSSAWMSLIKASVAGVAFLVSSLVVFALGWDSPENLLKTENLFFFFSGIIGLGIGDVFLIQAFATLGSARTLIIFSFEPVILGVMAYFLFDQTVTPKQFAAIFILIACVWIISIERARLLGHWDFKGVLWALLGVLFDNIGVAMTRYGFNATGAHVMSANMIRTLGAILVLFLYFYFKKKPVYRPVLTLPKRDLKLLLLASFAGTYVSLFAWLSAVKVGHLATLTALAGLGPIAGSLWEWYLLGKRPSKMLIYCLILVLPGLYLIFS